MLQNPVQLPLTLNPPCGYFFFCVQPVYVVFWSFAGSKSNPAAQERGTFRVCSWCRFRLQRISLDVPRSGVVQGYSDSASSMECLTGIGLMADGNEFQAFHSTPCCVSKQYYLYSRNLCNPLRCDSFDLVRFPPVFL